MRLAELVGHRAAVRALQGSLARGDLPGAYLFVGPPGVGKATLAQAFAAAVNCESPEGPDGPDACGACLSCRRFLHGNHPEIRLIAPFDEKLLIGQFWSSHQSETLKKARYPAAFDDLHYGVEFGRRRVYIVDRADTLTPDAANSLLKVLEEPPPYALFILLAPAPESVLDTIRSRSRVVRLHPCPQPELTVYLTEEIGLEEPEAGALAAIAEGRAGMAIRLAADPAAMARRAELLDLAEELTDPKRKLTPPGLCLRFAERLRQIAQSAPKVAKGKSAAPADEGDDEPESGPEGDEGGAPAVPAPSAKEKASRQKLSEACDLLGTFYRDLLAAALLGPDAPLLNPDRLEAVRARAGADPARLEAALAAFSEARRQIEGNANLPLVTEVLMLRLAR